MNTSKMPAAKTAATPIINKKLKKSAKKPAPNFAAFTKKVA